MLPAFFLSGSDVWFYAVDPASQELLWYNSSLMEEKVTGRAAQTNLKYVITGDLHVQVKIDTQILYKENRKMLFGAQKKQRKKNCHRRLRSGLFDVSP